MVVVELPGEDFTLDVNQIIVGKTDVREPASTTFYGNLLNFYFDGERLFDRFPSDIPVDATTPASTPAPDFITPPQPGRPLVPIDPITLPPGFFHYIRIPLIQIGADSRIRFLFKTRDGNGVLLYTSRAGGSFLGVELVDGQLIVVSNGGRGPRYLELPSGSPSLADGQWHELDLTRAGPNRFLVRVDQQEIGRLYYPTVPITDHEQIYIGGVPESLIDHLPSSMRSRKGFSGCMATLIINGHSYNLQTIPSSSTSTSRITSGCSESRYSFYSV